MFSSGVRRTHSPSAEIASSASYSQRKRSKRLFSESPCVHGFSSNTPAAPAVTHTESSPNHQWPELLCTSLHISKEIGARRPEHLEESHAGTKRRCPICFSALSHSTGSSWSHRGLWFCGLTGVRGSQGRFPAPGTGGLGPDLARTVAHSPSLPQADPRLTVTGPLIRRDAALQREPMPPHCRCPTRSPANPALPHTGLSIETAHRPGYSK
ncbi:uncharacterized protein [Narcine bancroftii]|uniref:uncharacterized protein n=1 Tax=Narcine bancroftii TaxID=1343680 RepID=UPI003832064A